MPIKLIGARKQKRFELILRSSSCVLYAIHIVHNKDISKKRGRREHFLGGEVCVYLCNPFANNNEHSLHSGAAAVSYCVATSNCFYKIIS